MFNVEINAYRCPVNQDNSSADAALKNLRGKLDQYIRELMGRNCRLVPVEDRIYSLLMQRGSLPYLAIKSHSVSRQELWPEVIEAWIPAFRSELNPGYRTPGRDTLLREADLELAVP